MKHDYNASIMDGLGGDFYLTGNVTFAEVTADFVSGVAAM